MDGAVSMTKGPIAKAMLVFAVPVFLGQLFQQLYNTVDSLIVGNVLGKHALAAVASSGSLVMLLVGFFNGLAMGASVVISQAFGAKRYEDMSKAIHSIILIGLAVSLVLSIFGVMASPMILEWMSTPEEVMPMSIAYLKLYFAGMTGLILYNIFSGIMRAVGDSRHPLYFLVISSILNVVLDLLFIIRFNMGVQGAALATTICQLLSACMAGWTLVFTRGPQKISWKMMKWYPKSVKQVITFGFPSAIQNSIISLANVMVQSNINAFGADAMAGIGAYSKIEGFVFLPVMSFNMATSTFVGQNIGAGERERTLKGARFGIMAAVLAAEFVGVLFFLFAPFFISLFESDPTVVAFGAVRARSNSLFYCLMAFTHAVSAVLRGGGKPAAPMWVTLAFWCALRITILTLTAPLHNFMILSLVYPITWAMSSITLFVIYKKGTWLTIPEKKAEENHSEENESKGKPSGGHMARRLPIPNFQFSKH